MAYEDESRALARKLIDRYGSLSEVHCRLGDQIQLVFKRGIVDLPPNHIFKFGYSGTGPTCFHIFLAETGVNIPIGIIEHMHAPATIHVTTISGGSLAEVREKIKAQFPDKSIVISEHVVRDGSTSKSVEGKGRNIEIAMAEAKEHVPREAQVISENVRTDAKSESMRVHSFSEEEGKKVARGRLHYTATIDKVTMVEEGKKGFLGIGKRPASYEVTYMLPAIVEVSYRFASIVVSFSVSK